MFCVWWNYEGVIPYKIVLDGQTIGVKLYSEHLEQMYATVWQKYPSTLSLYGKNTRKKYP